MDTYCKGVLHYETNVRTGFFFRVAKGNHISGVLIIGMKNCIDSASALGLLQPHVAYKFRNLYSDESSKVTTADCYSFE